MLEVNNFDLDTMVINPHILLIGEQRSGKSIAICSLLNNITNINEDNSIIISHKQSFYKDKYPDKKTTNNFDIKLIKNIMNEQVLTDVRNKSVIVLDNCLPYDKWWNQNSDISDLFFNSRHYNISLIIAVDDSLCHFTPELRTNFDYVFIYSVIFPKNIMDLYAYNMYEDFNLFESHYKRLTRNYSSMVISNHARGLTSQIFWYKAKLNNLSKDTHGIKLLELHITTDNKLNDLNAHFNKLCLSI
jgi:hypothetical protein